MPIITSKDYLFTRLQNSICFGTTKSGRLENGIKLPSKGPNFISYGQVPELMGRTYVHGKVRDIVTAAYRSLHSGFPDKVFKYAETGFKSGGEFKPHKTQQNGLSVDFIVPVVTLNGASVQLPTNILNKYGYNINFDKKGRYKTYQIDFEALGALIVALHKAAKQMDVGIWRVLFSPDLQPLLYKSRNGDYIKNHIKIPDKYSWVRHDEHIHVDFDIKCLPM